MRNLKEYRTARKGLPDLLNAAFLLEDGLLLNKDGSLTSAFYYSGPDLESCSDDDLDTLSQHINHAFAQLGTDWTVQADAIRFPAENYTKREDCFFADAATAVIDEERRQQYEAEGAHFESIYAMSFTYLLPTENEQRLAKTVVSNLREADRDVRRFVQLYKEQVNAVVGILSGRLKMRRMNSQQLLTHIHQCLTGLPHPVGVPRIPAYLDAILGAHDATFGFTPKIAGRHVRAISFMGFPSESYPEILEHLNTLPLTFRWHSRFIFLDPHEAVDSLKKYRRNWFQKRHGLSAMLAEAMGGAGSAFQDGDALRMTGDADEAVAEASEGAVRYGYYTTTVIIHDENENRLLESVKMVTRLLNNSGFIVQTETVNADEAILGSLPGHTHENIRRPMMHSLTFADMISSTSVWPGSPHNPCPFYAPFYAKGKKVPPLLYAATSGNTPFRFNLHVDDLGHTLIAGPTGAGKSVLLALIAAQHRRYPQARIYAFDKGYSMLAPVLAAGGDHYDIAGTDSTLAFYPLGEINTGRAEQDWAAKYIEDMCILQNLALTPARKQLIFTAIKSLATQESRTLTDFVNVVQDQEVRDALQFYTINGRAGYLLDADADGLTEGTFQVFEMEHLLSAGGGDTAAMQVVVPVLMYIFHRIEQRLTGDPTLLLLDEAWIMLDNPIFSEKIREWLKVLRKANCAVVFATQSLTDLADSPLKSVLLESCETKILLPNPEAKSEKLLPLYSEIGLSMRQIDLLRMSEKKRDYFIISPEGRRRIRLELGGVALAFCGVSEKKDVARVRQLVAQHGEYWPAEWLKEKGLPAWGDYFLREKAERA